MPVGAMVAAEGTWVDIEIHVTSLVSITGHIRNYNVFPLQKKNIFFLDFILLYKIIIMYIKLIYFSYLSLFYILNYFDII